MDSICKEIRKNILNISTKSGQGHIPTCFSVVEVIYSIYATMKHNPDRPDLEERDLFILSKGHASLALYCVLSQIGYFGMDEVCAFGAFNSEFGCHVDRCKIPGVEVSTGSLGHGIGVGVGMALALKLKRSSRRVFVVIGDGESNEGSVWEAIMVAVSLELANLTVVYDNNMSHSRGLQIHHPRRQFQGFGCEVAEVKGHDLHELRKELEKKSDVVRVIIANTVKGYGCKTFIENTYSWHRRSPNKLELRQLMRELG